jgi:hypothetical protein
MAENEQSTRPSENVPDLASAMAEPLIHRTFVNYLSFVDTGQDYRSAVKSFSKHAVIEYQMNGERPMKFQGRDEFLAYLEGQANTDLKFEGCAHALGQYEIRWLDKKPRLSAYVTAWHWFERNRHLGTHRPADWTTIGFVTDDFDFVEGQWLIARRTLRPAAGLVATGRLYLSGAIAAPESH